MNLSGRHALVTGATGDIGHAIAALLRERGAAVAVSGTREDRLRGVAESLGAVALPCDLSDRKAVQALPGQAEDALGGLDILVNNAGIRNDQLAMRLSDAEWDRVVEVNLTACFRLVRASLRPMLRRRWGRIVSITSIVGHVGNPGQANYCAAKAGLAGMTRAVALETGSRGITVNAVAPGLIETAMTAGLDEGRKQAMTAQIPLRRIGAPREVAAAVGFLVSDDAAYITGQTLHVNGGMAML